MKSWRDILFKLVQWNILLKMVQMKPSFHFLARSVLTSSWTSTEVESFSLVIDAQDYLLPFAVKISKKMDLFFEL